jgi:hypothetical protein
VQQRRLRATHTVGEVDRGTGEFAGGVDLVGASPAIRVDGEREDDGCQRHREHGDDHQRSGVRQQETPHDRGGHAGQHPDEQEDRSSATADVARQCAKHGTGGEIEQEDGDARDDHVEDVSHRQQIRRAHEEVERPTHSSGVGWRRSSP